MLGATGKASERERVRETRAVTNTDEDTEKQVYRVEKSSIIITGARCCEWLQPDQSRRWSAELSKEPGTRRRRSAEGRSPGREHSGV